MGPGSNREIETVRSITERHVTTACTKVAIRPRLTFESLFGGYSVTVAVAWLKTQLSESIDMGMLIKLAIAGFALYVIWTVAKPRWHFQIVVTPDSVDFVSGVPEAKRRSYETFFLTDLRTPSKLRIYGRRENNGRLTTLIKGTDDDGLKQRIRNFLVSAG